MINSAFADPRHTAGRKSGLGALLRSLFAATPLGIVIAALRQNHASKGR